MRKAERRLEDARLLLREGSTEGVCNRAYFAMHDAAHAALLASGRERPETLVKTHSGLISVFAKAQMKDGHLGMELGRSLNRVQDIRLLADYSCEPPSLDDARWALDQAETFVTAIRSQIV